MQQEACDVCAAGMPVTDLCACTATSILAEDHKPAQPDERARIMAAGGFLSEIGGITRVNGEPALH